MKQRSRHPALFHRVFLSHLLILLLCLGSGVILVDYLFVDGVKLFLQRDPIILIPALLALIGIVGLLALWTAGSVATPSERLVRALEIRADSEALEALLRNAGTEEIEDIIAAVRERLERSEHSAASRPWLWLVDDHLNIQWTDIDTAARLGSTPDEACRMNLRAFIPTPLTADMENEFRLTLSAAGGSEAHIRICKYVLSEDRSLLVGREI